MNISIIYYTPWYNPIKNKFELLKNNTTVIVTYDSYQEIYIWSTKDSLKNKSLSKLINDIGSYLTADGIVFKFFNHYYDEDIRINKEGLTFYIRKFINDKKYNYINSILGLLPEIKNKEKLYPYVLILKEEIEKSSYKFDLSYLNKIIMDMACE